MSADERGAVEEIGPQDVLAFWRTAGPDKWFQKDPAFDSEIANKFAPVYQAAATGSLAKWEETPESAAFLEIVERRPGEAPATPFVGWMFASSPALSAMEHPVYDVWVLDCKNASSSASGTSP